MHEKARTNTQYSNNKETLLKSLNDQKAYFGAELQTAINIEKRL